MNQFSAVLHHSITDIFLQGMVDASTMLVQRVVIGSAATSYGKKQISRQHSSPHVQQLLQQFSDYLDGKTGDFSHVAIDMGTNSLFKRAILTAAQKIPYGATCSYSELALQAGYPSAIRAAASVMRNNPLPLIIPCHRVIRKSGSTGGFCGVKSGEDAALKKTLLQLETTVLKKCL